MRELGRESYKEMHPQSRVARPTKIMQFGEGNFLRAFIDWMVQVSNDKGVMNSGVVVVQPLEVGRVKDLAEQDGLYTLILGGVQEGTVRRDVSVIDLFNDFINPYAQYQEFLKYGESEDLELIISNTTEAGIAFDPSDIDYQSCPKSFPGKLLALLKRRYDHFNGDYKRGLAIVPCELIDANGATLKKTLLQLAETLGHNQQFIDWLIGANHFANTLVDRIVSGYPRNRIKELEEELGYRDNSLVEGEIFHLFVVDGDSVVQECMPFDKAGLSCLYVDDITPYKEQKVKILNGAHTSMVPVAYLAGIDTVGEAIANPITCNFTTQAIHKEIIPTIDLPEERKLAFADSVIERFQNPFVSHKLISIALNSMTKYVTRILPSVLSYIESQNKLPKRLLFSLAALMVFYRGQRGDQAIPLQDDQFFLDFWKEQWNRHDALELSTTQLVTNFISMKDHFGRDLTEIEGLVLYLSSTVDAILENGMVLALENTDFS